jgi:hypothetical protein
LESRFRVMRDPHRGLDRRFVAACSVRVCVRVLDNPRT